MGAFRGSEPAEPKNLAAESQTAAFKENPNGRLTAGDRANLASGRDQDSLTLPRPVASKVSDAQLTEPLRQLGRAPDQQRQDGRHGRRQPVVVPVLAVDETDHGADRGEYQQREHQAVVGQRAAAQP